MQWAYVVTDGDSKEVKRSEYEYDLKEAAMSAGEAYVERHKPSKDGGWSVTTDSKTIGHASPC